MKAEFVIAIEGDWYEGDKRVTKREVQRELREAVKDRFEFLAKRTKVQSTDAWMVSRAKEYEQEPTK